MNKFTIAIIVLCTIHVSASVEGLTLDNLSVAITKACHEDKGCSKEIYGIFDENGWSWNYTAIKRSEKSADFMKTSSLDKKFYGSLLEEYCCIGTCAEKLCKVPKKLEEIELIKNFPENAEELLSIDFEPFKKFRDAVLQFKKDYDNGRERKGNYSAEIEDFLDLVFKNQFWITDELEKQRIRRYLLGGC